MKNLKIFNFFEKNLEFLWENSTSAASYGDVINADVSLFRSKDVLLTKGQLCQSFWHSVKPFKIKAKKIEGGGPFDPPLKHSRVKKCMIPGQ